MIPSEGGVFNLFQLEPVVGEGHSSGLHGGVGLLSEQISQGRVLASPYLADEVKMGLVNIIPIGWQQTNVLLSVWLKSILDPDHGLTELLTVVGENLLAKAIIKIINGRLHGNYLFSGSLMDSSGALDRLQTNRG